MSLKFKPSTILELFNFNNNDDNLDFTMEAFLEQKDEEVVENERFKMRRDNRGGNTVRPMSCRSSLCDFNENNSDDFSNQKVNDDKGGGKNKVCINENADGSVWYSQGGSIVFVNVVIGASTSLFGGTGGVSSALSGIASISENYNKANVEVVINRLQLKQPSNLPLPDPFFSSDNSVDNGATVNKIKANSDKSMKLDHSHKDYDHGDDNLSSSIDSCYQFKHRQRVLVPCGASSTSSAKSISEENKYILYNSDLTMQSNLIRIFSSVISLEKYPNNSFIRIFLNVINDNGSLLSVSVNAIMCALLSCGIDCNFVVGAVNIMQWRFGYRNDDHSGNENDLNSVNSNISKKDNSISHRSCNDNNVKEDIYNCKNNNICDGITSVIWLDPTDEEECYQYRENRVKMLINNIKRYNNFVVKGNKENKSSLLLPTLVSASVVDTCFVIKQQSTLLSSFLSFLPPVALNVASEPMISSHITVNKFNNNTNRSFVLENLPSPLKNFVVFSSVKSYNFYGFPLSIISSTVVNKGVNDSVGSIKILNKNKGNNSSNINSSDYRYNTDNLQKLADIAEFVCKNGIFDYMRSVMTPSCSLYNPHKQKQDLESKENNNKNNNRDVNSKDNDNSENYLEELEEEGETAIV